MNVQLKKSYAEVGEILNVLGNSYKEKLPKALLNLFETYACETSDIFINEYSDFTNVEISREALVIISILNLKYWEENPQKIAELKEKYEENERIYKALMNDSQKNELQKREEILETKELIEKQEYTFIQKITMFFEKLLKR